MPNPPEFLATISEDIWDLKYRFKQADGTPVDATLDDTFRRVARAAAQPEKGGKRVRDRWAERFHAGIADFGFLPAGRILAGAGTDRAVTLFNCFVLGTIADDLGAIFDGVKDAALTMQQGGGIGHDFSTLRPQGAPVASIGADASGPVSFMDVWDAMCRTIMSAGSRRGAMMATLRCDHPDIETFIDAKSDPRRLRNFNLSVLVTDAFLDAVRADRPWDLVFGGKVYRTLPARTLWERIMQATYDFAEPGVVFIDRVNERNNLKYCEQIHATNPCVAADTWVHTSTGPRQVGDLVGRTFATRIDGVDHPAGESGFYSTGRKPVVRLETVEGFSLRLTADHRVRRVKRFARSGIELDWCRAGELEPGSRIVLNDHRSNADWAGPYTWSEGYLLGLLIGDGTLKTDKAVLSVWQPAAAVNADNTVLAAGVDAVMREAENAARTLPHRSDFAGWQHVAGRNEYRLSLAALKTLALKVGMTPGNKAVTPLLESGSSACTRGFLRGFFDADGCVQGNQAKGVSVRLAQSDIDRLRAVQRMLLRLGIVARLYRDRRCGQATMLPDGKGGQRLYEVQSQHELVISGSNLSRFHACVGFSHGDKAARLEASLARYRRALNGERFTAVVKAVVPEGSEDVFDVAVPGINAFDANGLYVHNCGEQPLPPFGACLLGSINLAQLIENPFTNGAGLNLARLEERVRLAVRFLDNIIDVSNYPLIPQRQEAVAKRRIGLGVTGLADALIFAGATYGTEKAAALAGNWMAAIQNAAYAASAELAVEKGAFPLFDAKRFVESPNVARLEKSVRAAIARGGVRNGCLTSIAPTGTISLLAGNVSSGIEPVFDFHYRRRVLGKTGATHDEQVEDFAHAAFRRQFGPAEPLPASFVRAGDLTPHQHLTMQAALQPHVDSAISKTINCPEDISFAAFKDVYLEAHARGLKGCTTYRPNPVTGAVLEPATPEPDVAEQPPPAGEPHAPTGHAVPRPQIAAATDHADVVYMAPPLEREAVLSGYTYKLKWPGSDHAIYVTINDIERGHAGGVSSSTRRRPFEIFINTRNLEHYAWTVALTRMISAVFRRGGDVTFVAEELKAVFDPQGGHWVSGRYVPSLLAAIGEVIETHMKRTGFLHDDEAPAALAPAQQQADAGEARGGAPQHPVRLKLCPRCSSADYVRQEGCWVCHRCGFSRCG
jgi:ribonucleoside-diphosphate reductase alpha chain